jgi:hypothetical protein
MITIIFKDISFGLIYVYRQTKYLHIKNEQTEKEYRKDSIYNSLKEKVKHLGIHFKKYVINLYN